jgi:2-polyprenyl-3-methyl-5-hydroxy-6-metoxy-1,4-benzoquinol methylase
MSSAQHLADHPDRLKWNQKHRQTEKASAWQPAAILETIRDMHLPPGPVLELACGLSGNALTIAAQGREVLAVDISDVALEAVEREAATQGLAERISVLQADLLQWKPEESQFALVLCTRYWERSIFRHACRAVIPEGVVAWETFTLDHLRYHSLFPAEWCLEGGEPEKLLPKGFTTLLQVDINDGQSALRCFVASRR